MSDPILIRDLRPDDDIPSITALLHAAYAPLAAMGLRFVASHQDDEVTADRLHSGYPLIVESRGVIIGTATLYAPETASACAWYNTPGVYCFGQFAIHPGYQRYGFGARLCQEIERRASARGAKELALDTSEGAIHLRRWYERLGFRFVQYVSWPDTNYRSVVLSKPLDPVA